MNNIQQIKDLLYPLDLEEGDEEVKVWNRVIRKVIEVLEEEK